MSKQKKRNKKNNNRRLPEKKQVTIEQPKIFKDEIQLTKKKEEKDKRKRNISKHIFFFLFFFSVLIGCYFINDNHQKKKINLNIDIDFNISKTINKEEIELILNFANNKNYNQDNLEKYIKYYSQDSISINDTILIVNNSLDSLKYDEILKEFINNKNFIEENFKRYIDYYNNYNLSVDKTIIAVNNNLDKHNLKLNKTIEKFLNQTYFIDDNLERYLAYYEKNKNLSYKEIITRINSNLDKRFYKDVTKADTSKGNLILVNKYYYLDNNYVPKNLVNINSKHGHGKLQKEAYDAFKLMYDDAYKNGLHLYISSPYRSYNTQKTLYNAYSIKDGQKKADTYSAKPGYSEHQTGLSFDVSSANNHSINKFSQTNEFKWIKNNAHKYGFILRYPYGKKYITGYIYEPWHYRYVGVEAATYIYKNNITFEEYYAYFVN